MAVPMAHHACVVFSKDNRIRIETSRFGKQTSNGKPYVVFSSVSSRRMRIAVAVVVAGGVGCDGLKSSIQSYSSVCPFSDKALTVSKTASARLPPGTSLS